MDRLGPEIHRELARFDGLPPAQLQRIVEIWPEAVGTTITAHAWPSRLARDGTLHVATSSSTWAFELGQLAPEILPKLGKDAPSRLRFAPGPLPEAEPEGRLERRRVPIRAGPEDKRLARELVAGIGDEDLRKEVAKAAALSLAGARSGRFF